MKESDDMGLLRVDRLRELMRTTDISAFLVTNRYNLRYLTGFSGSAGAALITADAAFLLTDFRYVDQARSQAAEFDIIQRQGPMEELIAELLSKEHAENLAFEEETVTFKEYLELEALVEQDLLPVSGLVETLREVKDTAEIKTIKKACAIADAAFEHILTCIRPGMTERQIANELDFYMRSMGASGVSFETIVASGERSALPHGVATDKEIAVGEFVTLDFGCYYDGYVSDITRTIAIGEPSDQLKDIYQIVFDAQQQVMSAARPGMTGKELDAVARDYITQKGYGEAFGHTTGHGIGLEVHEGPHVSAISDVPLVANNIITNEPGIYLSGIGGVRIEDDLLITENGVESLTQSPKELIIL